MSLWHVKFLSAILGPLHLHSLQSRQWQSRSKWKTNKDKAQWISNITTSISYSSLTNYHNLSSQHPFISSQFCESVVEGSYDRVLCSGCCKGEIKGSGWATVEPVQKNLLPSSLTDGLNSVPCSWRAEVPVFFLAVSQVATQLPRAVHTPMMRSYLQSKQDKPFCQIHLPLWRSNIPLSLTSRPRFKGLLRLSQVHLIISLFGTLITSSNPFPATPRLAFEWMTERRWVYTRGQTCEAVLERCLPPLRRFKMTVWVCVRVCIHTHSTHTHICTR